MVGNLSDRACCGIWGTISPSALDINPCEGDFILGGDAVDNQCFVYVVCRGHAPRRAKFTKRGDR